MGKKEGEDFKEDKQKRWKEHFRKQYIIRNEREGVKNSEENGEEDKANAEGRITEEEIEREVEDVIRNMRKRKAPGEDGIPNEARNDS